MRDNLLLTLKYYDVFDYPLKQEEIWRWLFAGMNERGLGVNGAVTKEEFVNALDNLCAFGAVEIRDGYYFLPQRSQIVEERKRRKVISAQKMKKARRIAKLLGQVPGIKMIAIASSLAYANADDEADIDFFVVTARGKIWMTRFFAVIMMKLLNQRPNKAAITNKICLSYFVDEDNLNLEPTKVDEPDIHLIYLISQYQPLFDADGTWNKFCQANEWIKKYLVNFAFEKTAEEVAADQIVSSAMYPVEKDLSVAENFYKKIQLKYMAEHLRQGLERHDRSVIVNDGMLKLHSNDKRREINRMVGSFSQVNQNK